MKIQIRIALTVLASTAASGNRNEVTIERDLSLKTRAGVILGEECLETRLPAESSSRGRPVSR
jgi:hypothetical protein